MDPLSDFLSLLNPTSYVSGGVALSEDLAVQWPQHAGIKCYAVVSGRCWLSVTGIQEPILLVAGDCYLLPPGDAFCLATNLDVTPIDFTILRAEGKLGIDTLNNQQHSNLQQGCFLVGGHFFLTGEHADMLLGSLPPIVHIQNSADKTAMHWSLEQLAQEVRDPQPGSALVMKQLAYMMLIQALRLYISNQSGRGWLFALADKQLNMALNCIHNQPNDDWTLEKLAKYVGMSRSVFAQRFKRIVGRSPIEYLTYWRMQLACDRLKNSHDSINVIAASLGYTSESAFAKAFKRTIGLPPRQYSKQHIVY
ncbi:AraC family transcriptional regulator [Providencia burhodogranariea]|uniref:AraC family transcriptional regulator n=1 Tax=Providencia burhodogranariea DSM 19968 TaxID=1141662 RepID=K8WJH8_9GAMM|nr:AraC family transcriptional regulator [Providencia burhodogranariea DSM 19968]